MAGRWAVFFFLWYLVLGHRLIGNKKYDSYNFTILNTFQGAASCPAPPLFNQKCPVDTMPYSPRCHIFYAWKCIDLLLGNQTDIHVCMINHHNPNDTNWFSFSQGRKSISCGKNWLGHVHNNEYKKGNWYLCTCPSMVHGWSKSVQQIINFWFSMVFFVQKFGHDHWKNICLDLGLDIIFDNSHWYFRIF